MNANGGFPSNLLIFDGHNWEWWSALMKSLFGAQEVFEAVQNGHGELGLNLTDVQRATFKEIKEEGLQDSGSNVGTRHFWENLKGDTIKRSMEYIREISWWWTQGETTKVSIL